MPMQARRLHSVTANQNVLCVSETPGERARPMQACWLTWHAGRRLPHQNGMHFTKIFATQ